MIIHLNESEIKRLREDGGPGGASFKVGASVKVEKKYYDKFYAAWQEALPLDGESEWLIRSIGQCLWRQRRKKEIESQAKATQGIIPRWVKVGFGLVVIVLLGIIAARSAEPKPRIDFDHPDAILEAVTAQVSRLTSIQWQDGGSNITSGFFAYPFTINCGTNLTCTSSASVVTMDATGGGSDDAIVKGTNILLSTENVILDGSTNPRDITLGILRILQTPNIDSTRGIAIITDAAGFGDTKALEIDWTATGVAAGDFEAVIDLDIDTANSSGGVIIGLEITETTTGSATTYGMLTGVGINPIFNEAGTFGNIETAFTFDSGFTDVTSDFNSTGSDVQMFVSNGDIVYIGMAALFDEVEFILAVTASQAGIKPTFEYSDGSTGWITFSPTDNTNGMRQNGDLVWIATSLAGWAQDTVNSISGKFWIRITRTAVTVSTPPTEDLVQVNADLDFVWDSSGNVNIASLSSGFNQEIADAGFIRCTNNQACVAWELATPGTDKTLIVDASDILQFNGTFNATTLTSGDWTAATSDFTQIGHNRSGTWTIGSNNQIRVYGFVIKQPVTFGRIMIRVSTLDAGGNNHDVGIYDSSGTLLARTPVNAFAATGLLDLAIEGGGTVTLPTGRYYFALTGDDTTPAISVTGTDVFQFANNVAVTETSSSGVLPASITTPSDTWVAAGREAHFGLRQ